MNETVHLPLPRPARPKKRRRGKRLPAARRSAHLYIMVAPDSMHILRYLLEAEDNLGLMTVVDRRRGAVMLRFSPHQEQALRRWLEDIRQTLPFEGPLNVAAASL